MTIEQQLASWRERVEKMLECAVVQHAHAFTDLHHTEPRLQQAMRYALLSGGKRLRPLLVYAVGDLVQAPVQALDHAAAAIEMIHTYSLIHDDLPAMDNDTLRRGQPTTHIAFDEATAIIAGDALQTAAFSHLAQAPIAPAIAISAIQSLAQAAGQHGMCGGQSLDMQSTGKNLDLSALEQLHRMKTGALIRAAIRIGALIGNAAENDLHRLDYWANALGLAFQIRDDLLDSQSDAAILGKTAGKDQAQNKSTFVTLLGVETSQQRLAELADTMRECLAAYGTSAAVLQALADFAIARKN